MQRFGFVSICQLPPPPPPPPSTNLQLPTPPHFSLSAATPYLAGILFLVIGMWLNSVRSLTPQFEAANAAANAEAEAAEAANAAM